MLFPIKKKPAGHWVSLLLQENTPESSQIGLWIRWGEVTQTWKWLFFSFFFQLGSTALVALGGYPSVQTTGGKAHSVVLRAPWSSRTLAQMCVPLLASPPLVLPRCVPAEPPGLHNTPNPLSSLDQTRSFLPYSGAPFHACPGLKAITCSFLRCGFIWRSWKGSLS